MDVDMLNLKRAARGDEAAFEALISPYMDATYRLCLRMMGNEQDAADMAQEALVRAWRSLSTYKAQSRFSTWLYRITHNVCLDELRKRKTRQTESLQALRETGFDPPDTAAPPDAAVESKDTHSRILRAMDSLNEEHRAAILLRDVHGLTYDEIASVLDVNLNTAKSRIARARANLRSILSKDAELFKKDHV